MSNSDRLRVEDLMTTAVIAVKARDSMARAMENLRLADVRHLPVVDDKEHVIGVLSNRDLFRSPPPPGQTLRVADVMTRMVVTVTPDTPAHEAAELMLERKIGSLPVINDEEKLVGVITETDFLQVAYQALLGKRIRRRVD